MDPIVGGIIGAIAIIALIGLGVLIYEVQELGKKRDKAPKEPSQWLPLPRVGVNTNPKPVPGLPKYTYNPFNYKITGPSELIYGGEPSQLGKEMTKKLENIGLLYQPLPVPKENKPNRFENIQLEDEDE